MVSNMNDAKKLIWTIGKKLNMEEQDIRAVLNRETGKSSMRACTDQELGRVVLALRQLQGADNHTGDRASKRMLWKIRQLEVELGWADNPKRLQAFLRRFYQVDSPEWLTRAQAWRAIESLKKMVSKMQRAGEE